MKRIIFLLSFLFLSVAIFATPPPGPKVQEKGVESVLPTGNVNFVVIPADQIPDDIQLYASLEGAQLDSDPGTIEEESGIMDFIKGNWGILIVALMGFLKVVVNLTPTDKDNKVFGWLDSIFNLFIPNYRKGGGTHNET